MFWVSKRFVTWRQNSARFAAERRKDQRHISGLVHDANAVEAALLRVPLSESRRRARPFGARGDGDSCRGGGGSSMGATETNGSSKSNAYVEPEPQEDPSFISLDQASKWVTPSMGFRSKSLYMHLRTIEVMLLFHHVKLALFLYQVPVVTQMLEP